MPATLAIAAYYVKVIIAAIMAQPGPAKPGSIPIVVTEENALVS